MVELLAAVLQSGAFRTFLAAAVLLLFIVIVETVFCVVAAMRFKVETLSEFRKRFTDSYTIAVPHDSVTRESCKNNWFLWLSVCVGSFSSIYVPLISAADMDEVVSESAPSSAGLRVLRENTMRIINNAGHYLVMMLLVPFYLVLRICSFFERTCRLIMNPVVFFIFWVLAKMKILHTYHSKAETLVVDSLETDATCSSDIIYRKPIIRILLHSPETCPDSVQKDNINHFTSTLRAILPSQRSIKFKTEVVYSKDERELQAELPLTMSYLRATYDNIIIQQTQEA